MRRELMTRFLHKSDNTGRFVVQSKITGITYFVEPIDKGKPNVLWGDVDPATKKLTGDYGNIRRGAVKPEDSMITKENGFKNIDVFMGSPLAEIDRRDKVYEKNRI